MYHDMQMRTYYSLFPSDLSTVHGNQRPITLAQSILYDKYIIIPSAIMLTAAPTINVNGVLVSEINLSTNGLPKYTAPKTRTSLKINFPANVALANFHGLYLAKPSGMYTRSSGIGVSAATNAPPQPYLLNNLCKGSILLLTRELRIFLP